MPHTFVAVSSRPLSLEELRLTSLELVEDVLQQPKGTVSLKLFNNPYGSDGPVRLLTADESRRVIQHTESIEAGLSIWGPEDAAPIRVRQYGVFADDLGTCASMFTAMVGILAVVKIGGVDGIVEKSWDYCASWRYSTQLDTGRPLSEVLDCLRLPPGRRSPEQAIEELMERTRFPCRVFDLLRCRQPN